MSEQAVDLSKDITQEHTAETVKRISKSHLMSTAAPAFFTDSHISLVYAYFFLYSKGVSQYIPHEVWWERD